jgi:hypothetical protein
VFPVPLCDNVFATRNRTYEDQELGASFASFHRDLCVENLDKPSTAESLNWVRSA